MPRMQIKLPDEARGASVTHGDDKGYMPESHENGIGKPVGNAIYRYGETFLGRPLCPLKTRICR